MDGVQGGSSLLFLLAAAALAARPDGRRSGGIATLPGFAFVWLVARVLAVPPSTVALVLAAWCAAELLWAPSAWASRAAAGLGAGFAAVGYVQSGLPWMAVTCVCVLVPLAAGFVARRDGRRVRDEALVGLTWAAVLVGVLPELVSGWQSAVQLNRPGDEAAQTVAPGWVWGFIALATALGIFQAWRVRRR